MIAERLDSLRELWGNYRAQFVRVLLLLPVYVLAIL